MVDLVKPLELLLKSNLILLPGKSNFPVQLRVTKNSTNTHIISPDSIGELDFHKSLDELKFDNNRTLYVDNYDSWVCYDGTSFDLKDNKEKLVAKFILYSHVKIYDDSYRVDFVRFYDYFERLSQNYEKNGLKLPDYLLKHKDEFEKHKFTTLW